MAVLRRLEETDFTIAGKQPDVRGRKVLDSQGEEIGEVDDLLIDDVEMKVRMLRVEHGGILSIGTDHFLVPVDAVTSVTDGAVHIDRQRSRLTDVSGYDPAVTYEETYYADVYEWWNYPAYWGLPTYPDYGRATGDSQLGADPPPDS